MICFVMKSTRYYPIFTDLKDKKVVVIGGGRVAERKVHRLLEAGANVVLVSPEITPELQRLANNKRLVYKPKPFSEGDVDKAWLVIAATDDTQVQEQVYKACLERQIFCNVVDKPQYCGFIVPSEIRRGDLNIAISTGGKSPALAKTLRIKFEAEIGTEFGDYLELLGRLREHIQSELPNTEDRSTILKALGDLKGIELYANKQWSDLETWIVNLCGQSSRQILHDFLKERQKNGKAK